MAGNNKYPSRGIPLIPEDTTFFDIGRVSFGVEVREFNERSLAVGFSDPVEFAKAKARQDSVGIDRNAVPDFAALHVLIDGGEYLRFDNIPGGPHYHYITWHENCMLLYFYDSVGNGDFIDWIFNNLRTNLPAMLVQAQAPTDAAEVVQQPEYARVLAEAEAAMRSGTLKAANRWESAVGR